MKQKIIQLIDSMLFVYINQYERKVKLTNAVQKLYVETKEKKGKLKLRQYWSKS